jgi:hypothetical protein
MKIEVYEQRILIPAENKYLYKEETQIIAEDKVFLGINEDEKKWVEITEEQKQEIENKLNEELNEGLEVE